MKRNFIKLISNQEQVTEGKEPLFNTFVSPSFVPYRKMYEAMQILEKQETEGANELELTNVMIDFIVDLYGKQFTKEELLDGLHAPDANAEIMGHIEFFAQGKLTEERKKELAKMLK